MTNLVLRYKAPFPGGTHSHFIERGIENYGCLMASAFQSWVGKDARRVSEFFPRGILSGELRPDEKIRGKTCHVLFYDQPSGARQDVLYFDSETFFLLQWDTFYTDMGPKPVLSRSRRFRNICTEPLADDTWNLALPEELRNPRVQKPEGGSPEEKGGAARNDYP